MSTFGRWLRTVGRLHPAQVVLRPVHRARMSLLARSPRLASAVAGRPCLVWRGGPVAWEADDPAA